MSDRMDSNFRTLVDLREERDRTAQIAKAAERAYRVHEAQVWEEVQEAHGKVKTVTIDLGEGYGTIQFQRRETIYSKIVNEEEFEAWVKDQGREDEFLKPGVRKAPLNEDIKDRLDRGEALPPGTDFSSTRAISITRK